MKPILLPLLLAASLLGGPLTAAAQPGGVGLSFTGQPRSYAIEGRPYQVTGYGRARFGMSLDEVKALIGAGDRVSQAAPQQSGARDGGSIALTLLVQDLQPVPGPATVTYVFGASSQRLIAINVYWLTSPQATAAEHAMLTAAAASLASGFVGYQWPALATARGHVTAPEVLVVFAGRDEAGRGVEIRLDGVPYDLEQRASGGGAPPPPIRHVPAPGPAQLRLSVVANVDKPDL